uniref:FIIND domain-containing protein n=1 Tax=Callorhinchus milii TaxID=7868 RepID=A0A4W3JMI4_CALMI
VESENEISFSITLPEKGNYECAETGLRWESKSNARIFYEYNSWDDYISDVQRECWIIGGPLFNIRVSYGDIAAVHLPHFICESGILPRDKTKIIHLLDDTLVLENPSEIHLSHVVQRNQPLTLMGVILGQVHQVAIHAVIMIYQTFRADCSILHVYVLPNDGSLIQSVSEKEIRSLKIQKPPQITSVYYGKKYRLTSFSNVAIKPLDIKFSYFRYKQQQPFHEVYIQESKYSIKLCLTERSKLNVLWEILLRPDSPHFAKKIVLKLKRCVDFVHRHKKEIICCLKTIQPILLHLRDTNVITKSEESEIVTHNVEIQQNKAMLQLVMNKGEDAEDELYKALQVHVPRQINDLQ